MTRETILSQSFRFEIGEAQQAYNFAAEANMIVIRFRSYYLTVPAEFADEMIDCGYDIEFMLEADLY